MKNKIGLSALLATPEAAELTAEAALGKNSGINAEAGPEYRPGPNADPAQEFLEQSWPGMPFVVHGLDESVRPLTSLPFLKSLDALLDSWPMSVQAHLPDLADEASAIDAMPVDAKKLFRNRMGLLFNNAQNISPVLNLWLEQLKQDLGLPRATHGRCMIYATPDGKGTAPHFDHNINFVLQLQGTKKWRVAFNSSVTHPTQRHTLGTPVHEEIQSYANEDMPTAMPEDQEEFILKPGSMLFVPRGFWHSTEAEGEALALNFTFSQPMWIDLFSAALRSRLLLSPEWRELADGAGSTNVDLRQSAENQLDALLENLIEDLPNWRASDILASTEGS